MAEENKGKEKKEEKKDISDNKAKKDEKKESNVEVITAIYKLNLHCQECGNKIKRHLLITQGVQSVEIDIEKGEIKAKGKIDPLKIHKLIEKKSNKKVELVSPKPKPKDTTPPPQKKPKEVKQPTIRTITVKVHMHCDKCEHDLRIKLLKHKGIFSVKTDQKEQTVTIEGSIEPEKLLGFLRKRVHKNAEIISSKEQKQKGSEEKDKDKNKEKLKEIEKEKEKDNKEKLKEKEKKGSEEKIDKMIVIQEDAKVEIVVKDDVPYIIHYVYAPQLFSDDNPNACCIV